MTSRDQSQQHGVGGGWQIGGSTYDLLCERDELLSELARLRARCASLEAVVEAARQLREAKRAMMRHGWEAHSQEAEALSALFQALAALDQPATTTQEGKDG
jgi:hypothetical protein